ncbi:MAG: hypothetical protein ACTSU5_17940 [Promethearchaeota archaeon]
MAGTLPAGRKWGVEGVVTVLAHAWPRGVSVHHAAERLNHWTVVHGHHAPGTFADGRQSRAVPHQTTVNAWVRLVDLSAGRPDRRPWLSEFRQGLGEGELFDLEPSSSRV